MGLGLTDESFNTDDLDAPNEPSVDQGRKAASVDEQTQEARRKNMSK